MNVYKRRRVLLQLKIKFVSFTIGMCDYYYIIHYSKYVGIIYLNLSTKHKNPRIEFWDVFTVCVYEL